MKLTATVWTLSWDTEEGVGCRVFGSEADWEAYFCSIIEEGIRGIETAKAKAIRAALTGQDVSLAYELWQASYKPEIDSYNWDSQLVEIDGAFLPAQTSP